MIKERRRKIALVTGGSGYIGINLVRRLIAEEWTVHVITRSSTDLASFGKLSGEIVVHQYDGSIASMLSIMEKAKPDVVFHLASLYITQHKDNDVDLLIDSNIKFGTHLLESMSANNIHKIINTGTGSQHYRNEDYCAVNLYAATKQAFDAILAYYADSFSLKTITLKLLDTYGPDDPRPKLFYLLRQTFLCQKKLEMSPGEQLIDLVYIDDVIEAFLLAAERLIANQVEHQEEYVVSSGSQISLKKLVSTYEKILDTKLNISWGGKDYRIREVMVPWNRGKLLPNWKSKVELEEGLSRIIADIEK